MSGKCYNIRDSKGSTMKKILALIFFLVLSAGAVFGAVIFDPIIFPNMVPPVNAAISNGYIYQADVNASPGVSPRVIIYATDQSSYPLAKTKTIGPSTLDGTPRGLAISPTNENLWVALENTSAVKVFAKDGTDPHSVTGISFGGPKQIAVAPDGKYVYVVDSVNYRVYVINASARAKATEEAISEAGLFGIAVSPDNTLLAVGVNAASGKIKIYNIIRNSAGEVTDLTLKTTITESATGNLVYPTYLAFDNASERLFVRVHKNVADACVDALVYNTTSFTSPMTITLENADGDNLQNTDYDFGNYLGEALTISGNGQFL